MINSAIGHCLNVLGIVKKEQHHSAFVMTIKNIRQASNRLFSCPFTVLSLRTLMREFASATALWRIEHLWSYWFKKTPGPELIKMGNEAIFLVDLLGGGRYYKIEKLLSVF